MEQAIKSLHPERDRAEVIGGAAFGGALILIGVVGILLIPHPSGATALVAAIVVACGAVGVAGSLRGSTVGLSAGPDELRIRNLNGPVRVISAAEITSIDVRPRLLPGADRRGTPFVVLRDGTGVWIEALTGDSEYVPANPDLLDAVANLRALYGVSGKDAWKYQLYWDTPATRALWSNRTGERRMIMNAEETDRHIEDLRARRRAARPAGIREARALHPGIRPSLA